MAFLSLKPNRDIEYVWSDVGAALYQVYYRGVPMLYVRDPKSFERLNEEYFGQFVGPVAGRIEKGILGEFDFAPNERGNALHSSDRSWCFQPFTYTVDETEDSYVVAFVREGNLFQGLYRAEADYILDKRGPGFTLRLRFSCTKDCPCNLTSHLYFSLGEENISNVVLAMDSREVMSYDEANLPRGYVPAEGIYDFTAGRPLKEHYDHSFRLSSPRIEAIGTKFRLVATLSEKNVIVYTDAVSREKEGASKGFTLEFVRHPIVDESAILPAGQTEILSTDYVFQAR